MERNAAILPCGWVISCLETEGTPASSRGVQLLRSPGAVLDARDIPVVAQEHQSTRAGMFWALFRLNLVVMLVHSFPPPRSGSRLQLVFQFPP